MLRPGLLVDTAVLAAPATPLTRACEALGAAVTALDAPLLDEAAVEAAVTPCRALVVDGGALLAEHGLPLALDAAWCAVRAVANGHFVPSGGGKVVYVAPRTGEGMRAGLENLARTPSIEWSRYAITLTAVLPGEATTGDELADLVAYLVSPAGDYFSGCRFDLQ